MENDVVNESIRDVNILLGEDEKKAIEFLRSLKKKTKKELVQLSIKYLIAILGIHTHFRGKKVDRVGVNRWDDRGQAFEAFYLLTQDLGRLPKENEWLAEIASDKYQWKFSSKKKNGVDLLINGLGYSRARSWHRQFTKLLKGIPLFVKE